MGILILAVLLIGVVAITRWLAALIPSAQKPPSIAHKVVALEAQKLDYTGFEIPAFIRRGMAYPVLTEKKPNRKRKTKTVFAVA